MQSTEEHFRTYHLRHEISEEALKQIEVVRGVEYAFARNRYAVAVNKGAAFTWDEVGPPIDDIIARMVEAAKP